MQYKPRGYTAVAPYLVVADIAAALDFTEKVFWAERLRAFTRPDGTPRHAEVRIEDTVVMFGQMPGGPAAHVHVYVPDPDAAYARALEAGAQSFMPVEDQDVGGRRGGVTDTNGITWWFTHAAGEPEP
jgi:uncharacterized glyoxalase superfamily protein PhnB